MIKIFLIKRGAIGDLLLATPLIRQLKQKFASELKLDLLVSKSASVAVKENPYLDKVFILEDQAFALKGAFTLIKLLLAKRNFYDYVFVLDKHWYFNLLAKLLAAKLTIGFSRSIFSAWLLDKHVSYHDPKRYQALYYLDLLNVSALAVTDYEDLQLDITILESDKSVVDNLLYIHQLADFYILVNSGGNNSYETSGIRMLPKTKVLSLLQKLLTLKPVILLGGKVDVSNYTNYMLDLNKPPNLFNWAGKLSLAQSAYLLTKAAKLFTTDCGAMHLAVAVLPSKYLRAFFGPTNPQHFLPKAYLDGSAIWLDEDIYNPNYQLKGELRKREPAFFQKINFGELNL